MQNNNADIRLKQEMVNSLLHGLGILFGIVCIPILLTQAVKNDNIPGIVGSSIYGFTFLMVFTFSTLYHGFQHEKVKQLMKILDHISIYFLIAGTYTPFLLIYMNNATGITLLCILWGLHLLALFSKVSLPAVGKFYQQLSISPWDGSCFLQEKAFLQTCLIL